MIKVLFVFVAALTLCVNSYAQQVKDWAKIWKFAEDNRTVTVRPKAVFMGDSITEQWGVKDMDFFTANNFKMRGISGQTTIQMLVRMRPDVIALNPKYVVIMAGTNDIAQNLGETTFDAMLDNIKSMCELARLHRIKPIVCSVTPCDHYRWKKELTPAEDIVKFNSLLQDYCKKAKIPYVDYYSAMNDSKGALKAEYTTDRCHLTLEGYKVLEGIILGYLK